MLTMKPMFTEYQIIESGQLKKIRKNASSNGGRAGKKGGVLNENKLKDTASKYAIYEQDYIDAYTEAFKEASKSSSLEDIVKRKAKHNGTSAACNYTHYDKRGVKKSAEKFGELASLYYDCYVVAFNLKRKQVKDPINKKLIEKVPSLKWVDYSQCNVTSIKAPHTISQGINILIEALDSLSEFENELLNPVMSNNNFSKDTLLTPHYVNSQINYDSCRESSSDTEEFSFARIKKMRNCKTK